MGGLDGPQSRREPLRPLEAATARAGGDVSVAARHIFTIGSVGYFAVTMESGPNWDSARSRREQDAWDEHAAFMDGLVADGFIILGGPIGDGEGTMHAIEANDEQEIETRFAADPWAPMGLLKIAKIEPWTIWLDGRA